MADIGLVIVMVATCLVGCNVQCAVGNETKSQHARPNIVLLLADDLGYGDLGCYGNENISTPNIDRLAAEGLRFTRMYSQPVCSPTRAALLTGRYPIRSGIIADSSPYQLPFTNWVFMSHAVPGGIPDREKPVLSDMLKQNGYKSALIGKWHLGSGYNGTFLPMSYGFDSFYGIPDTHCSPCSQDRRYKITDADVFSAKLKKYQSTLMAILSILFTLWYLGYAKERYVGIGLLMIVGYLLFERAVIWLMLCNPKSCILMENKNILEQPYKDENMTLRMTTKALNFMETSVTGSQPFFLFMSYLQPHLPPIVSPYFKKRSGVSEYYDSVLELDWSVGKIMQHLRDLKVDDNTLVIFASDNGVEIFSPFSWARNIDEHLGSTMYTDMRTSNRVQLRGGKMDVWEGGVRVPTIFKWPGVISPGGNADQLTNLMDIYPTINDILKTNDQTKIFDGKSILPILKSPSSLSPHKYIMHYCTNKGVAAVTTERYKVHYHSCNGEEFDPPLLFDILKDLGESHPLPVEEHRDILAKIRTQVKRHEASVVSYPSEIFRIPRPWNFLCNDPPFCQKSLEEDENFDTLFTTAT